MAHVSVQTSAVRFILVGASVDASFCWHRADSRAHLRFLPGG